MSDPLQHLSEADRNLLARRAERLDRVEDAPVAEERLRLLVLRLGGERYACETRWVQEIAAVAQLTRLPWLPAWLVGTIYLHGRVLGVVDLRQLFGLPLGALAERCSVVVLRTPTRECALLADTVEGIVQVAAASLTEDIATLIPRHKESFRGVTHDQIAVLDGEKLVDGPLLQLALRQSPTR